jgi:hypothetical protein
MFAHWEARETNASSTRVARIAVRPTEPIVCLIANARIAVPMDAVVIAAENRGDPRILSATMSGVGGLLPALM